MWTIKKKQHRFLKSFYTTPVHSLLNFFWVTRHPWLLPNLTTWPQCPGWSTTCLLTARRSISVMLTPEGKLLEHCESAQKQKIRRCMHRSHLYTPQTTIKICSWDPPSVPPPPPPRKETSLFLLFLLLWNLPLGGVLKITALSEWKPQLWTRINRGVQPLRWDETLQERSRGEEKRQEGGG